MEFTKNISKKTAEGWYDLNLSSDSASDEEVTPGQEREAGRSWTARDSDGGHRPAGALPELGDHEQPLDPPAHPAHENPQQPHLEQPRGPPGFDPRVRIQE